jgi:hypothetical protein
MGRCSAMTGDSVAATCAHRARRSAWWRRTARSSSLTWNKKATTAIAIMARKIAPISMATTSTATSATTGLHGWCPAHLRFY